MSDVTPPLFPPPEIWRVIFEYLATLSRAYLIPLRCVCKAWSDLAKVAKVRFREPMTRLLTVSARDDLPTLCAWAHDQGGLVEREALLAVARTDDVELVTRACEWSCDFWCKLGEDTYSALDDGQPDFFAFVEELCQEDVMMSWYHVATLNSGIEVPIIDDCGGHTIADLMLIDAARFGSVETCRYLIEHRDARDLFAMLKIAAIDDNVPVLRLAEEKYTPEHFKIGLKRLVVLAAKHHSAGVLKIIKNRNLYPTYFFWKLVFIGAAAGGHLDTFDTAKLHLLGGTNLASPIAHEPNLLDSALKYAMREQRGQMCQKLVEDGCDGLYLENEAKRRRDPILGRAAVAAGLGVSEEEIEDWERISRKRRRVPFDLGDEDERLSD